MEQNFLAIKAWVYFCYNFRDPETFICYICVKAGRYDLCQHLLDKFNDIYDAYGSENVMNRFFVELDNELKTALVEYAIKEYAPSGLRLSDEEKRLLKIN